MKLFTYILIIIAIGLIAYNGTKLDFNNLFTGDSAVAAIGILAAACVILLMVILQLSYKVKKKSKNL